MKRASVFVGFGFWMTAGSSINDRNEHQSEETRTSLAARWIRTSELTFAELVKTVPPLVRFFFE